MTIFGHACTSKLLCFLDQHCDDDQGIFATSHKTALCRVVDTSADSKIALPGISMEILWDLASGERDMYSRS